MISYSYKKNGFTLIELLVVITIIGMLLALLSPAARASRRKAQVSKAQAMVASLQLAISMYEADTGNFPPDDGDGATTCKVLVDKLTTGITGSEAAAPTGWNGPYIEFKPSDLNAGGDVIDPWGNSYIYIANNGTDDASLPSRHPKTYDLQNSGGEATN
jgi:general secretion pathway protein G